MNLYYISNSDPSEKIEGVHPTIVNAIRAARQSRTEQMFLETADEVGKTKSQILSALSAKVAIAFEGLTTKELVNYLPEDSHVSEIVSDIAKEGFSNLTGSSAKFLRDQTMNAVLSNFRFGDLKGTAFESEINQAADQMHKSLKPLLKKKSWSPIDKKLVQQKFDEWLKKIFSAFKSSKSS
jgi:hypothetical protein